MAQMPVMGGLAATRAVRALEEAKGRSRLRIVGCTGTFLFYIRHLAVTDCRDW